MCIHSGCYSLLTNNQSKNQMKATFHWVRMLALPAILFIAVSCDDTSVLDAPNAPTNLRSVVVDDGNTELAWDNNSTISDGFIIEKRDDNSSAFVEVARVQEPSWIDTSPMLMTKTYQYRVAAYRGSQMSGYSNTISLSHMMEVPRQFRVDASVTDQIKLLWETNNNPNAQVRIQRSFKDLGSFSTLATVAHSGSYVDASATAPGPWYYRIAQISPNNITSFSPPVGAAYGLSKTISTTENQISNHYGCALSYQSFVLPEKDLLIQFSKYRAQQSYSFYISRLSDGSRLVNSSISESGINVTFTPDQEFFLADNKNPSASGKVLQLHRTSNGEVAKTIPVGNLNQAGLISDSKAIATVFSNIVNGNNHYDVVEVDMNSGAISVLQEDVWVANLATTSKAGHYLIVDGSGTARAYNSNHNHLTSWNIGSPKILTYSLDGTELMVGLEQSIETYYTVSYGRKLQVDLAHQYKYASYSPNDMIYTTYCSPVTLNPPPQPTTWVHAIDRNNGQVDAYRVSSTPAMVYALNSTMMHFIYTDSIRTLSLGWMSAGSVIAD